MKLSLRQLWLRIKPRKLRTRILAAMVILSVPPLLLLGFISTNISRATIVANHMTTNVQNLKTASEVADLLLRNVINMHRLILANPELRTELKASYAGNRPLDVRTSTRLQNLVVTNLIDTRYIDSICLFDRGFQSVCYGSTDAFTGYYVTPEGKREIASSDWYRQATAAKGKEVFFSYNVLQGSTTGQAFSSVKLLRDPDRFQTLGMLVINIRTSMFREAINETEGGGLMVLDSTGGGMQPVYEEMPGPASRIDGRMSEDAWFEQLRREGYLSIGYRNKTTDWTLMHIVESGSLLKDANRIGSITWVFAALIAAVAMILSLILSGSIIRPLLRIKKLMVDWSKGSGAQTQLASFEEDEIGAIGETFKRISSENQQLEERLIHAQLKEREAELQTLQSQIKPHFLYNTLDSIYWMAIKQKNRDIAAMAVALSESFKLSLNKGKETIPVFKELKHIEHYITIQNLRFKNRFTYIEDVAPELMHLDMLKLLLQPLVENAIYHGLEPKLGEGTVRLTGRLEDGIVTFVVADDGIGIKEMSAIHQGYGIGNVKERLTLYYGPTSSFTIKSEVDEGTTIEIRFRL